MKFKILLLGMMFLGFTAYADVSPCDSNQATRVALATVYERAGAALKLPGDCVIAQPIPTWGALQIGQWKGRLGFVFRAIFSSDNGYDTVNNENWRWQVFVPFDACDAPEWAKVVDIVMSEETVARSNEKQEQNWTCFGDRQNF
jgi:hypothetical protein